jgi:hypothetical protein
LEREAALGERLGENLIQRMCAEDGKLRVDGLDLAAKFDGRGCGIELPAQEYRKSFGAALVGREVGFRNSFLRK